MRFLAVFLAAFLGCCAAIAGVWSADRVPPTDTISVRIEPQTIMAGEAGEVRYVYQRFRACDRRSTSSVVDATGRAFVFATQTSPPITGRVPGKSDTFVRPFRVSIAAKPGPAFYHVELEDMCNPLQWLWPVRRTIEVPFTIAERKAEPSSFIESAPATVGRISDAVARLLDGE